MSTADGPIQRRRGTRVAASRLDVCRPGIARWRIAESYAEMAGPCDQQVRSRRAGSVLPASRSSQPAALWIRSCVVRGKRDGDA